MKVRCHICHTLISCHNSLWACTIHILSHDIGTSQDIAAAAALTSECEANGEPFPIHKLPTPPAMKKESAGDVAFMQRTFAAPSHGTDMQPYHQIKRTIAEWIGADCFPHKKVEMRTFREMTRTLDLKCPDFGGKVIPHRWDTAQNTG